MRPDKLRGDGRAGEGCIREYVGVEERAREIVELSMAGGQLKEGR